MPESTPRVPLVLGAAGLLPFLGAVVATALLPAWAALGAFAAAVYGVAILAFLGGVHWGRGLGTGRTGDFVWSVIPSLLGFFAVFLPAPWALGALSAAFALVGAVDVATFRRAGPQWYAGLRIALTVVVVAALAAGAAVAPDNGPAFGLAEPTAGAGEASGPAPTLGSRG